MGAITKKKIAIGLGLIALMGVILVIIKQVVLGRESDTESGE